MEPDAYVVSELNVIACPVTCNVVFTVAILISEIFHYNVTACAVDVINSAACTHIEVRSNESPVVIIGIMKNVILNYAFTNTAYSVVISILSTGGIYLVYVIVIAMIRFGIGFIRTVAGGVVSSSLTGAVEVIGVIVLLPICGIEVVIVDIVIVSLIVYVRILTEMLVLTLGSIVITVLFLVLVTASTEGTYVRVVSLVLVLVPALKVVSVNVSGVFQYCIAVFVLNVVLIELGSTVVELVLEETLVSKM